MSNQIGGLNPLDELLSLAPRRRDAQEAHDHDVPPQPSAGDSGNHPRDDDPENQRNESLWSDYVSPSADRESPAEWSDDAYPDGRFGGIPASAAAIAGLEKQMYINSMAGLTRSKRRRGMDDGETVTGAPPACAICLDGFEMGDILKVMPCSHWFHEACLAKWLALSRLCPCCRHALMQPAVRHDHDAAAAPSSTPPATTTAEGGAAAAANQGRFEGSSRARRAGRIRRRYRTLHAIVRRHGMNAAPTTATVEGGVASAAANLAGNDEGSSIMAATQAAGRRSNRARQANVRLCGPEWDGG